ncbi:MAG: DUF4870 domain-containing protein [Micrococcales bacterium]|nr:DUF4870 domain-containing protein [Micrococcales bacterium]MCL2667819.1 DUF4870 domain-containing protein [Micrococcales bacterium]
MTKHAESSVTIDERNWGMVAHLVGGVFAIVGAVVVWLLCKDKPGFVRDQACEALNFQVAVFVGEVLAVVLSTFVRLLGLLGSVAWSAGVVFAVIGAVAVNRGQPYRYPFGLRLVR